MKKELYSKNYAVVLPEKTDLQVSKNFKIFKGTIEQATLEIKKYEFKKDKLFAGIIIFNNLEFLDEYKNIMDLLNEIVTENTLTPKDIYLNKIYHHGIDHKCYVKDKIVYCSTWTLPFYSYLNRSNNSLYANCMRHRLHMIEFLRTEFSKSIL